LRVGDLGCTTRGAPFLVTVEELESTNARAAPGVLDAFATGPLPGTSRLVPSPEVEAEERAWSQPTLVDWSWLAKGGRLESPGERRSLVVPLRAPPVLTQDGAVTWLEFALPPGAYATELLEQCEVSVPTDRRG
jgi:tRNA(Glu) U13 pseudouridine synthase TruD